MTQLETETRNLIAEHARLARELYQDATEAARDGNRFVTNRLMEQADLHEHTAIALADLSRLEV